MSSTIVPDSTYPPLEKPVFESRIPSFLLREASEHDKFILAEISKISQFVDWSIKAQLVADAQLRKTNGRLVRAEKQVDDIVKDKKSIQKGWKFIVKTGAIVAGVIGFGIHLVKFLHGMNIL